MDVQTGFFYFFALLLLFAALRVITARNPVHAVLFLMLAFSQAAAIWLLLGAEFLAVVLVLVYLGAVMVLFLFVVMMLDINFVELRQGFLQYLPVGGLVGVILLAELAMVVITWGALPAGEAAATVPIAPPDQVHNTEAIGNVLYTDYLYLFQASGLILLVAMVGAIVLTLRSREGVKRQSIGAQVGRTRAESVELKDMPSGSGV